MNAAKEDFWIEVEEESRANRLEIRRRRKRLAKTALPSERCELSATKDFVDDEPLSYLDIYDSLEPAVSPVCPGGIGIPARSTGTILTIRRKLEGENE